MSNIKEDSAERKRGEYAPEERAANTAEAERTGLDPKSASVVALRAS